MKRDINIVPLSRDHHYGLLFCWKIRRGLAKHTDLERIARYVTYFWHRHLEHHFREEEDLLFRGRTDGLCLGALEQHRQIAALVQAIAGYGVWSEVNYVKLANLVDEHIRFEERHVFPYLEQALSKEQLSAIGEQLSHDPVRPSDEYYEDEFWS
jgi:hemerythrin-like domain-containing protein